MLTELDEFISKVLSIDRIERCKNIPTIEEKYITEDNVRYILSKLESIKITWVQENTIIRRFPQLYNFLNDWSQDKFSLINPFSECYYLFINNINAIPTCKCCDNKTLFKAKTVGYNIYCSGKCSSGDEVIIRKIKETFISKGSIRKKSKKSDKPRAPNKELVRTQTDTEVIYNHAEIQNILKKESLFIILNERVFKNKYPIYYQNIINWAFIHNHHTIEFKEILYLFIKKDIGDEGHCMICSKKTRFISYTGGYNKYCSVKCSSSSDEKLDNTKATRLKIYGSEYPFAFGTDISKKRIMELYGVDNVSSLPEIKLKKENTTLKNYNTKYFTQTEEGKLNLSQKISRPEHREATRNGLYQKYGATNPSYLQHVIDKRQSIYKDKFDINITEWCLSSNHTYIDGGFQCEDFNMICPNNHNFIINWQLYNIRIKGKRTICTVCNPITKNRSYAEIELFDYIKEKYIGEIFSSDRSILEGKELDILIPELNLAFEYNGLYWHSDNQKDKYYHREKTMACQEKNIRLVHIFEDDWLYKKDIVKGMITDLLCIKDHTNNNDLWVSDISLDDEKEFLENNHILGYQPSEYCIGLKDFNDRIISIISMVPISNGMLILRHKTIKGYDDSLCFSKLLGHLGENTELSVYSDLNWGLDNFYENIGFEFIGLSTEVNQYQIIDGIRESNITEYSVHSGYIPEKDLEPNYPKIYDCGQAIYSIKLK